MYGYRSLSNRPRIGNWLSKFSTSPLWIGSIFGWLNMPLYGRVYFVCGLKRQLDKIDFVRSQIENAWLSHINLKVFCFRQRFIRLSGGSICWLPIDVLQSYREQIQKKLKCMAQPYKIEGCLFLAKIYPGVWGVHMLAPYRCVTIL